MNIASLALMPRVLVAGIINSLLFFIPGIAVGGLFFWVSASIWRLPDRNWFTRFLAVCIALLGGFCLLAGVVLGGCALLPMRF